MDQLIIKILLIGVFIVFGIVLLRPGASARSQAFRTLGLLLFLIAAIIAVIFPGIVNDLAVMVGIGRGADLVLYAFIVVFLGHLFSSTRRRRVQDAQITELARKMAISEPLYPENQDR